MFENIDIKAILPLTGVAMGWLLSEASSLWRTRREQRKVLGKAILKLLELRTVVAHELETVLAAKEAAKSNVLSDEDRLFFSERESLPAEKFQEELSEISGEIAAIDPFLANEVGHNLRSIYQLISAGRTYSHKYPNQKFWDILFIKMEEHVYSDVLAELRKSILKLTKRKSLILWLRAWWYFRHEKNDFAVYGKLMQEAKEKLEPFRT